MRLYGIVCLDDHSHYLNFRPGFRSLSSFLARACHNLDLDRGRSIVAFDPPSLSSASTFSRTHQLRSRQPHSSTGTACQATLSLSHPHSLPCLYSIVAFHGHQSLKSRIACIEHSLVTTSNQRTKHLTTLAQNLFGTPSCTICRIQPQHIASNKGKKNTQSPPKAKPSAACLARKFTRSLA
jgi:hypothetical protein